MNSCEVSSSRSSACVLGRISPSLPSFRFISVPLRLKNPNPVATIQKGISYGSYWIVSPWQQNFYFTWLNGIFSISTPAINFLTSNICINLQMLFTTERYSTLRSKRKAYEVWRKKNCLNSRKKPPSKSLICFYCILFNRCNKFYISRLLSHMYVKYYINDIARKVTT